MLWKCLNKQFTKAGSLGREWYVSVNNFGNEGVGMIARPTVYESVIRWMSDMDDVVCIEMQ